ncbi:MAG: hypothetical protein COT92_02555 [Candidatus Doudnabacteria bacterium CG10_big_fil_rev_8_21_14_0_10_42_18]|uniref:CMP/dCMP-type deaminase domain-containing protein n=1 Tax=Candidatus Doudnabacteria bacterium CG10_big_fil_rev_8_21_14_0_10_42_18 TaxID=1974552 RepID=A0A2H0VAT1_9BACT|nr:MAG: hypothetical protein COT92_02555 [Candidatus Doudnabacteria bacterium CG10_big_fil_rev_8_21_14_0_10_42_18]
MKRLSGEIPDGLKYEEINNVPEFPSLPEGEMEQHIDFFNSHKEKLIDIARAARTEAKSYRNFHVGSAILGVKLEKGDFFYDAYLGANITLKKLTPPNEGVNKRCAERMGLESAIADKVRAIPAIITVSDQINTGDKSLACDALHPCEDCRQMIRVLLEIGALREDCRMLNVNDKNGVIKTEETSLGELLNSKYKTDPKPKSVHGIFLEPEYEKGQPKVRRIGWKDIQKKLEI